MHACQPPTKKSDRPRRQAKKRTQQEKSPEASPLDEDPKSLQEFKVHQAELVIQNEELKRAQHELTDLHSQYERLYRLAPCGYITLNPQGTITRVNLTGASLLGATERSLLQSPIDSHLATAWQDTFLNALRNAAITGEVQSLELQLKRGKDALPWVRANITADRDESGAALQWFVVLMDIKRQKGDDFTLQRQPKEEKRQLNNQLHHAQKTESIGALASSLANDFNNILTIVIGNYELMKDDLPVESPLTDNLEEIRSAAIRGRGMVRQLLALARRDNMRKTTLDINAVVKESLTPIQSTLPANIIIRSQLPVGIDPVFGNRTQINQLITNLCANAVDAMVPAGGTLSVELANVTLNKAEAERHGHLQPGAYIKLVVADTGCGMDAATREQIFEPYFTTKPFCEGKGIGLSVVHSIVDRHHGRISVESQANKGTVFTILFPVCTGQVTNENTGRSDLPKGHERILLVDDEAAIAKMGQILLGRMGYTVSAVIDPREALERMQADPWAFDLVITDMAMPNMTGDVLTRRLLKLRPDLPVLLCTGFSETIDTKKARRAGIGGFLMKPMNKTDIAIAVREALDRAKADKQFDNE